jgi:hypothetical protein
MLCYRSFRCGIFIEASCWILAAIDSPGPKSLSEPEQDVHWRGDSWWRYVTPSVPLVRHINKIQEFLRGKSMLLVPMLDAR